MAKQQKRKGIAGLFSAALDSMPTYWSSPTFEHANKDHSALLARLAPNSIRAQLAQLEPREDRSSVPVFEIDRTPAGLRVFYFAPGPMAELLHLDLFSNDRQPEYAFVRFRTNRLTNDQLNVSYWKDSCDSIVERKGIPAPLESTPEEIKYRLAVTPTAAIIQSPLSTNRGMLGFLTGRRADLFLEGKLDEQRNIIERFSKLS